MAALRIHAHVERAVVFHGKTADRIVQLHGRDAEVGEDNIGAAEVRTGERLGQAGEIQPPRGEYAFPETKGAQAGFGFGKLDGIGVQAQKPPTGLEQGEEFLSVSAEAKGAVHGDFAWSRGQDLQDFGHHDWAMRSGRRFTRGQDFGNGFAVAGGMVFLVFLPEMAGVFAGVARSAFVGCWRGRGRGLVGHKSDILGIGSAELKPRRGNA